MDVVVVVGAVAIMMLCNIIMILVGLLVPYCVTSAIKIVSEYIHILICRNYTFDLYI